MFYSETILAKKGPLARVWLAAHWEKKLTKANIVSTDIQSATKEISEENHAPMALRLSGQLLLGVVRIYSRKARYLLEDCNDALLKLKMAFRPGNVDLSTATVRSTQAQAASLILPDTLTELDLYMPMPDLDFDFDLEAPLDTANLSKAQDITLDRSLEYGRNAPGMLELDDEDDFLGPPVDLDLGIEDDGPSIELGRDAAPERRLSDEFAQTLDLDKTFDESLQQIPQVGSDGLAGQDTELPRQSSPFDRDVTPRQGDFEVNLDEETPRPAKQTRKRRIVQDDSIELSQSTLSRNARDTSAITKKQRLLHHDPIMLSLMHKSLTGGLALDAFAPPSLNPAVRSLLAPEFLRRMAAARLKRKRSTDDEGVQPETHRSAEVEDIPMQPLSDFEVPDISLPAITLDDTTLPGLDVEQVDLPAHVQDEANASAIQYATLEPPSDPVSADTQQESLISQVTSIDTQRAISHIRDSLNASSPSTFTSLSTGQSRAAASDLFFQVLLLATKNALTVSQTSPYADISIEAKASLFTLPSESSQIEV